MPQPTTYQARRTSPFVVDRTTMRVLLLPQPLLSTLYLLGIDARLIEPSYAPLLMMALFPLTAAIIACVGLRSSDCSRRRNWAVLEISIVELISSALLFVVLGLGVGG